MLTFGISCSKLVPMITVQEITQWADNVPNHKYILSDDARKAFGYIKQGEKFPTLFNKPLTMDWARRKYVVLVRTKDFDPNVRIWRIPGSKGNVHTVTLDGDIMKCSCPAATYRRGHCKHIEQVEQEMSLEKKQ